MVNFISPKLIDQAVVKASEACWSPGTMRDNERGKRLGIKSKDIDLLIFHSILYPHSATTDEIICSARDFNNSEKAELGISDVNSK
ncbi:hypothetical protein A4R35_18260 [Thermogemmatispora tikiterensis]|uniref:Uncharacterized protein n=1 Tax=Thermogemmatispora tikiterensis TaxID=1825093 RepID=A0A328VIE6_9CHLR|nr:hypothetical protein A4R35_18260 [Thermogemmatispora tikiterensis]